MFPFFSFFSQHTHPNIIYYNLYFFNVISPTQPMETLYFCSDFTFHVYISWSAIESITLSSFLPPLLIMIIVWTSVEFWCETFASLWRIKHVESWPFVCGNFNSTGKNPSLEKPQKILFIFFPKIIYHPHAVEIFQIVVFFPALFIQCVALTCSWL